jgi:tetratricopeptide (TPR) repeat protein
MDLSTPEGRKAQGALIRQAAQDAGLSLEELAKAIGCSRALIYQYVAGARLAQPDNVQKIAQVTGKPLTFFYGAEEEAAPSARALAPPASFQEQMEKEREALARERTQLYQTALEQALRDLRDLHAAQVSPPDFKTAASTCERLVSLARQLGRPETEAQAQLDLGNARLCLCEFEVAQGPLRSAVSLFAGLNDGLKERSARQSLGYCLMALGKPEQAMEQFQRVAQSPHWHNRWQGLVSISAVHELSGRYREAMDTLHEAQDIVGQGQEPRERETATLYVQANLVNVYVGCGDYQEALPLARETFRQADRLQEREQSVEALLNLGTCERHLGAWGQSHAHLSHAFELARYGDDQERTAVAQASLCGLSSETGDFETAKQLGKDALATALSLGSWRGELLAHQSLCQAYALSRLPSEATYHLEQAMRLAEQLKAVKEQAWLRAWRAELARQRGDFEEGHAESQRAWETAERMGALHLQAFAALVSARCLWAQKKARPSQQAAANALAQAQQIHVPDLQWRAHALLGQMGGQRQKAQQARDHLKQAVDVMDSLRGNLSESNLEDTVLEDGERFETCLAFARLLRQQQGEKAAARFIVEQNYPPLEEAWREEKGR